MHSLSLTTILAIWGATVSTVLAGVRVIEYLRDRRPRMRVTFSPCVIRAGLLHAVEGCSIEAINIGQRPVTVEALVLRLDDGRVWWPMRPDFYSSGELPVTLTESKRLSVWVPKTDVPLYRVQWAEARTTDGAYRSKSITYTG